MSSSKSSADRSAPTDKDVQALLLRHRCPTPLHMLRTLLLGNISSPLLQVSPLAAVRQAWGGELPEFGSAEEVEELMQVLVNGMWNRLTLHQNSRTPFRLPRFEVAPHRPALLGLARTRAEEVEGFLDGLFGGQDELSLPQKAHEAVQKLAELQQMFEGAAGLLADPSQAAPEDQLKQLLRNLQQMTNVADREINATLQSCRRARGRHLEAMAAASTRRMPVGPQDDAEAGDAADDATGHGDDEPDEFVESPLSQSVTRNGVTVQVEIYGDGEGRWILEVVDTDRASHVWDERFETDQQALEAALRALDEEPLTFAGGAADRRLN